VRAKPGNFGYRTGVEAVEYLLGDPAALRGSGVVDGAQLLITLRGDVHFVLRVAGVETVADLGLAPLGEVFDAVPEQPSDRSYPASTEGVLLRVERQGSDEKVESNA
jgi:hypothetical protein